MLKRMSRSWVQRLAQEVLALGVRTGSLEWLPVGRLAAPVGPGLEDFVRTQVPDAVSLGVILGPPRANGKPVLQVFGPDGRTLAFGKVGHDERAACLVSREGRVLLDPTLSALPSIDIPEVIFAGQWNGLEILLLTPMSAAQSRASSWTVPMAEMVELAQSAAVTHELLARSSYWAALVDRLAALKPSPSAPGSELQAAVSEALGDLELGFGRWHGDWAPWNMGRVGGRLQLWDWEQSSAGVPLGFDLVHFLVQRELDQNHGRNEASTSLFLGRIREGMLAAPPGWWSTQDAIDATILLYVIEILHRYASLAGDQPPPELQRRVRRLQDLAAAVARGGAPGGK